MRQRIRTRDEAFVIAGVEIGSAHVTVVLTDLRGQTRASRHELHPVRTDPNGTMALVRSFIDDCLRAERIPRRRLLGIGVAVPNPVRRSAPGQLSRLLLPSWREHDVRESLASAYAVPVLVDNDANLGALAERWWGAGRAGEDLTFVKIATGVGAGFVLNGEVYRGSGGTAGEIGHLPLDPEGPGCICGHRGCLVTFIGAQALREQAKQRMAGRTPTIAQIVSAAREGEPEARDLIEEVGQRLGIAVAGLLNLLNPAIVVLGGEITSIGDLLLDPLRASIRVRALSTSVAETRIVISGLGDQVIALGAATLVLDAALRDRSFFPASVQLPRSRPPPRHVAAAPARHDTAPRPRGESALTALTAHTR